MIIEKWNPFYAAEDEGAGGGETPPAETSALSGASPDEGEGKEPEGGEGGEGKEAETPPAEPLTADSITLPEGMELDSEALTPFLEAMNNSDLSRAELAQKLIDMQIENAQKGVESANEAAQTQWNEMQTKWQDEMKALPEIGGEKLDETLATIKTGLVKVGADKAFFDALDATGAGNHPEIVKVLHALTKGRVEGSPVSGDPAHGKLSQADKLFGGS